MPINTVNKNGVRYSDSQVSTACMPAEPKVGEVATVELVYVPSMTVLGSFWGEKKPGASGYMLVQIPPGWQVPQSDDPSGEAFVRAFTDSDEALTVECLARDMDIGTCIRVYPNDAFREGEPVRVIYGDRSKGGVGATVSNIADAYQFFVYEDIGTVEMTMLGQVPTVNVFAGPAESVHAVCTHDADEQGRALVRLVALDRYGNPATEGDLDVNVALNETTSVATFRQANTACTTVPWPKSDKVVRVAISTENGLSGHDANPVHVRRPELQNFWGDIHGHTALSDALGTAEGFYRFGRDVALLDFCALSDHDFELGNSYVGRHTGLCSGHPRSLLQVPKNKSIWDHVKEVTNRYNEPGRYVTLTAYEWSSGLRFYGDRTVYYRDDDPPIFCHRSPDSHSPEQLFAALAETNGICVIHTPIALMRFTHDGQVDGGAVQPLLEIFSEHGCSERHGDGWTNEDGSLRKQNGPSAQDLLGKGWRLGFVAGSDSHAGTPGRFVEAPIYKGLWRRGGLTCVLAPELTREAVFDALRARRCYATTGERILLDFRINNALMGSEIRCSGKPELSVEVHGTAPISDVAIIRNNEEFQTLNPEQGALDVDAMMEGAAVDGTDFYYIRVTQVDGHQAWSSPIWIDGS